MKSNLYIKYLEKCLDKPLDNCTSVALNGGEAVEVLWPLNNRFRPHFHRIASLPYEAAFEKEADDAILAYVFSGDEWTSLSAQAWRVLLERQQNPSSFFNYKPMNRLFQFQKNCLFNITQALYCCSRCINGRSLYQ